jgi:ADP-heptose:LPS heptosyltransferase
MMLSLSQSGTGHRLSAARLRHRVSTLWQARKHCGWFAQTALRRGRPDRILHFGVGPGDDLLCTTVIHELKRRGQEKIWMMSKHAELFEHNAEVDQVIPIDYRFREYAWVCGKKWQVLEYARIDTAKDQSEPPKRHILAELCGRLGISGDISLRPYFHCTADERKKSAWAAGQVVVQSSGLGGQMLMRNKQWYPERFQAVVDRLKNKFAFVQLGAANDPALEGVTDLRGKTRIRESAAILANCRMFIGNVGFLMHLARAVECPSVTIFGGREAPWQSGYGCNLNLYSAMPCAPCWLWNRCDYNRACMDSISAGDVIQAIETLAARSRNPLPVDRFTL